jgi:hypothetical protein
MILAKEEDENEHHSALIAAAFAKPLASVTASRVIRRGRGQKDYLTIL